MNINNTFEYESMADKLIIPNYIGLTFLALGLLTVVLNDSQLKASKTHRIIMVIMVFIISLSPPIYLVDSNTYFQVV